MVTRAKADIYQEILFHKKHNISNDRHLTILTFDRLHHLTTIVFIRGKTNQRNLPET
jgi:hypothetical protein